MQQRTSSLINFVLHRQASYRLASSASRSALATSTSGASTSSSSSSSSTSSSSPPAAAPPSSSSPAWVRLLRLNSPSGGLLLFWPSFWAAGLAAVRSTPLSTLSGAAGAAEVAPVPPDTPTWVTDVMSASHLPSMAHWYVRVGAIQHASSTVVAYDGRRRRHAHLQMDTCVYCSTTPRALVLHGKNNSSNSQLSNLSLRIVSLSVCVCVRVCMSIHLCRYAWMDPVQHLVATSVLFAVGAAALRSAGCAINDIADREVRRASKRID